MKFCVRYLGFADRRLLPLFGLVANQLIVAVERATTVSMWMFRSLDCSLERGPRDCNSMRGCSSPPSRLSSSGRGFVRVLVCVGLLLACSMTVSLLFSRRLFTVAPLHSLYLCLFARPPGTIFYPSFTRSRLEDGEEKLKHCIIWPRPYGLPQP